MARSRGKIEEGSVTFTNETEKDIVFTGVSSDPPGFTVPPVVKLISVASGANKFLSAQSNLFFQGPLFVPQQILTPPYPIVGSSGLFLRSIEETSMSVYGMAHPDYSTTISAAATNNHWFFRLGQTDQVTVPFNGSSIEESGTVQLIFRAKFGNWEAASNDFFTIWFVNKTTIAAASDSTPGSGAQTQTLTSKAYMLVGNEWKSLNDSSLNYNSITGVHLNTLDNNFNNGKWVWIKLDITAGSEALADLGGFSFFHNNNDASNEYAGFANGFVFIWGSGYDPATNNFWIGDDLFDNPKPRYLGNQNFSPNVNISFSNVTNSGMKIRSSSTFTGVVRYLCSEYG